MGGKHHRSAVFLSCCTCEINSRFATQCVSKYATNMKVQCSNFALKYDITAVRLHQPEPHCRQFACGSISLCQKYRKKTGAGSEASDVERPAGVTQALPVKEDRACNMTLWPGDPFHVANIRLQLGVAKRWVDGAGRRWTLGWRRRRDWRKHALACSPVMLTCLSRAGSAYASRIYPVFGAFSGRCGALTHRIQVL